MTVNFLLRFNPKANLFLCLNSRCVSAFTTTRNKATISVKDLKYCIDHEPGLKLVDTRSPKNYSMGHIVGARSIHDCFTYLLKSSDKAGFEDMTKVFTGLFSKAGISGKNPEMVVCYEEGLGSGFAASCRAWYLLKYFGHPKVKILDGGLTAWKASGGGITTSVPEVKPVKFQPDFKHGMMATRADIIKALSDTKVKLIDVRDPPEWCGLKPSPLPSEGVKNGRIPGSIWVPWTELMKQGKDDITYMMTAEEIEKYMQMKGVGKTDDIIVYCFKGARASNTYLQLKESGFENVRNYFASWNEFGRVEPDKNIDSNVIEL